MHIPTPLQSAIAFAHRGHAVLPLHWPLEDGSCSCRNPACTGNSRGKHPFAPLAPNGKDNATTDIPTIKSWFEEYPLLNAGVCTDKFAVVDIDPRNGGREGWSKLVGTRHGDATSWRARTGSGGDHIYFDASDHPLPSTKLGKGVDLKAQKGYVVVPGSLHFSGKKYFWFADCQP
jgi:Bifunctional DNA primase/polymerase, N-terminal